MNLALAERRHLLKQWHEAQREHVARLEDSIRAALGMVTNLECRKEEAKRALQALRDEWEKLEGVET